MLPIYKKAPLLRFCASARTDPYPTLPSGDKDSEKYWTIFSAEGIMQDALSQSATPRGLFFIICNAAFAYYLFVVVPTFT